MVVHQQQKRHSNPKEPWICCPLFSLALEWMNRLPSSLDGRLLPEFHCLVLWNYPRQHVDSLIPLCRSQKRVWIQPEDPTIHLQRLLRLFKLRVLFSFVHLEALALLLKWEGPRGDSRDVNYDCRATRNARNSFGTIYTRTPIPTATWKCWGQSLFLSSMFEFSFQFYNRP